MPGKSIFLSHAVADAPLAEELVKLIETGMGVEDGEIFCSSLKGYGIPVGEPFVDYIKSQLQGPKIVILLLTPSYYASPFCLSELGAAWAMSHKIFPLVVPPFKFENMKAVLTGVQGMSISDRTLFNEVRDYVNEHVVEKPTRSVRWDTARDSFFGKLDTLLKDLKVPKVISENEFQALEAKLGEAKEELLEADAESLRLVALVEALKQAKDKEEVAAVEVAHTNVEPIHRFEELSKKIRAFKQVFGSTEVFRYAISNYYEKHYPLKWQDYEDEYSSAERRNLIAEDGRVLWGNGKLSPLADSFEAMRLLIKEHRELLETALTEKGVPLDPDDEDFWDAYYF